MGEQSWRPSAGQRAIDHRGTAQDKERGGEAILGVYRWWDQNWK